MIPPSPRLVVGSEAEEMVGGPEILHELREAWKLKPFRMAKGFAFYDEEELKAAMKRKDESSER